MRRTGSLDDCGKQCYTYAVNRDGKRCTVHSCVLRTHRLSPLRNERGEDGEIAASLAASRAAE